MTLFSIWTRGSGDAKFLSRDLAALCLVEQNYLCNFGGEYHEEPFCIFFFFEFGPMVQEMLFKRYLI